jgi:hypothetical protein
LYAENYINNKVTILIRADEKFTAENKILQIENEDLRGIIFKEKGKRKYSKFLNFNEKNK